MAKKKAAKRTAKGRPRSAPAEPIEDEVDETTLKEGYIRDFISGRPVRITPEEIQAVQVFARRLVDDYGYPKSHIVTRPQYRVRSRPSDEAKSFPVDIAVFRSDKHTDDELFMVVECKSNDKTVGVGELKTYLDMCGATVGVWFNGREHEYFWKVYKPDGSREYRPLPNIPRVDERIEDIGLYK